jgi:hypothetical protein
MFWGRRLL